MKDIHPITWLLAVAAVAVFGVVVPFAARQEKPARETRTWRAYELPGVDWRVGGVLIDVVDTEGVCLYIARADRSSQPMPVALAAVPKTQLPSGTGCQ